MTPLRFIRYGLWGLIAVIAAAGAWAYWQGPLPSPRSATTLLDRDAIGGPFELTDENGRRLSSTSLAGKPYAIFFGFTHCPDVCPTTMMEMANVIQELGDAARDFRVFFVSVDPVRDTPELLRVYTDSFDPRIIGLTGSEAEIAAAAKAFRAVYMKVPTEGETYTMEHTAIVYLMNGEGRLAGTIAYGEAHDAALDKVKRLLAGG
ncbi:SCO family protein [Phreatobacter stygius]|uniref:SCO family protein n=1 Tax=Phreatobacter stygius TaxID=1940610 RepID=A0A4D7BGS0_9HYPH|nr:SCO family protein [Phreatobacter stygius]QCI66997.1 SCO family protein [Phreatobacter stygius]